MAKKLNFTEQHDQLKALIDEAMWSLTDSELEQLRPADTPADVEHNINKLKLSINDPALVNHPFHNLSPIDLERADFTLLRVLRDPQYFPFTCYHLFSNNGVDPLRLLPFQHVALLEFWYRQFPMLMCSRGFGKCKTGDTIVQTDKGFKTMAELAGHLKPGEREDTPGLMVAGEGGMQPVEYAWCNGEADTKVITTRFGYKLEITPNDAVRVVSGSEIIWKHAEDIAVGDRVVIHREDYWTDSQPDELVPPDLAYLFGCLVGDGGYTVRGRIGLTSSDDGLVSECSDISSKYFDKRFAPASQKYQHYIWSVEVWDSLFMKYGFNSAVCGEKEIPASVLKSPCKETVTSFLSGLFDTDGCVMKNGLVEYCSKSEILARQVHFVLSRLGIISAFRKKRNKKYGRDYYYITISGEAVNLFRDKIGFHLHRKRTILEEKCKAKRNSNVDTIPIELCGDLIKQLASDMKEIRSVRKLVCYQFTYRPHELTYYRLGLILKECEPLSHTDAWQALQKIRDDHYFYDTVTEVADGRSMTYELYVPTNNSFIANGFISHNSFLCGLYILLKLTFHPGIRIAVIAKSQRQTKIIWEYCERIWNNSPIFRDLVLGSSKVGRNGPKQAIDRFEFTIGESHAIFLPIGPTGDTIRGIRAQVVMTDEFASINEDVYSIVVQGFGAVSGDPTAVVESKSREKILKRLGLWTEEMDLEVIKRNFGNQSILTGTASYQFNHFYRYWKEYHDTVMTKGDPARIEEMMKGAVPVGFDWRRYSIFRVSWDMIPHGYMDEATIGRAQQMTTTSQFLMEYGACPVADSDGFFPRSKIERCVCDNPEQPLPEYSSCNGIPSFRALLKGSSNARYIYGIDPALVNDNFSIVIIEVWPDHRRIVYCWTTRKSDHRQRVKSGGAEANFYRFAANHIRSLTQVFPPEEIHIDSQGGGGAIEEALSEVLGLPEGSLPILRIPNPDNPLDTDWQAGHHLLKMVNFRDNSWLMEANWGLKKDLETRSLLFPRCDSIVFGEAYVEDIEMGRKVEENGKVYDITDTQENLLHEIEELKNELAMIVHTQTTGGMERWDLPNQRQVGGRAGALRKDRYSALVIANSRARQLSMGITVPDKAKPALGGYAGDYKRAGDNNDNQMYVLPGRLKAKWGELAGGGRNAKKS